MTRPRKQLISHDITPYYHCVSRCVRRSFLCGVDSSGRSFEHRRSWIEERLLFLSSVFAIDICAYAVMSNHYHTVLHINKSQALEWTEIEVAVRWHRIFKGNLLSNRFIHGEILNNTETKALTAYLGQWRSRLMDISWFLRLVNETIAREANAEDNCTGRFWEGRFKSQALLDEKALAACMVYVDLNPVRAKVARTPETSDYTSAKARIKKAKCAHAPNHPQQQVNSLFPFVGNSRQHLPQGLPFRLTDYLTLLQWTGKLVGGEGQRTNQNNLPALLDRLQIEPKHWLYSASQFESRFKSMVGCVHTLKQACAKVGLSRTPGLGSCRLLS